MLLFPGDDPEGKSSETSVVVQLSDVPPDMVPISTAIEDVEEARVPPGGLEVPLPPEVRVDTRKRSGARPRSCLTCGRRRRHLLLLAQQLRMVFDRSSCELAERKQREGRCCAFFFDFAEEATPLARLTRTNVSSFSMSACCFSYTYK